MSSQQRREALQADIEAFLAAGGEIQEIESSESAQPSSHEQRTRRDQLEYTKRIFWSPRVAKQEYHARQDVSGGKA